MVCLLFFNYRYHRLAFGIGYMQQGEREKKVAVSSICLSSFQRSQTINGSLVKERIT